MSAIFTYCALFPIQPCNADGGGGGGGGERKKESALAYRIVTPLADSWSATAVLCLTNFYFPNPFNFTFFGGWGGGGGGGVCA